MSITDTALAIGTCILACTAMCIIIWQIAWSDGYDAGRAYEQDRQAWKRLRETRAQDGIRSKTTFGGADGAPPWYVTVSARRAVAVPGIPLASLTSTVPLSQRRLSDTGEIRALAAATDHYIARVTAEGDAWRRQAAAR